MVTFPNCKINIGLYITNRRADGYHDLETVFYPTGLKDALELVPAGQTAMTLYGLSVAGDKQNNLVWKAYELLRADFPERITGIDIHLLKNIPMGAGMGGGSADGAFMLRLMNEYFELGLNNQNLADFALRLGSDAPFFIYNTPRFAMGRGEHMQPIGLDLSIYQLQLICPGVHVSTAAAFKMIKPKPAPFDLRTLHTLPIGKWAEYVSNDFEEPVFELHPELAAIKQRLYDEGAIYAAMSGSGSTVYGLFEQGLTPRVKDLPGSAYLLPIKPEI